MRRMVWAGTGKLARMEQSTPRRVNHSDCDSEISFPDSCQEPPKIRKYAPPMTFLFCKLL